MRVGTGLYDTAIAAFEDVSAHYNPVSVNVVALLADGADLDPDDHREPPTALPPALREPFDDHRHALTTADAHGLEADALVVPLE
jgi:hypothetical protein